jgi:ATP/maltotriose-dependent transcriptional regulator MalT
MRRQLELAQRLDLKAMVAGTLANLVLVLAYRGSLEDAREIGRQARAMTSTQGNKYFLACAEAYLSVAEFLAGNFEDAERLSAAAVANWDAVPTSRPFALALLSRAVLMQERVGEAYAHARDAYEQLKTLGTLDEGETTVRLALIECLVQKGDIPAAKTILEEAARRIFDLANAIDEDPVRESFLGRIPENRRILELSRQLGSNQS